MKRYGVQITVAKDGSWCVSQLVQEQGQTGYMHKGLSRFVDHSNPSAAQDLLQAVTDGLNGRIRKTGAV